MITLSITTVLIITLGAYAFGVGCGLAIKASRNSV